MEEEEEEEEGSGVEVEVAVATSAGRTGRTADGLISGAVIDEREGAVGAAAEAEAEEEEDGRSGVTG